MHKQGHMTGRKQSRERGKMKMDVDRYRVKENQKVKLKDFSTKRDVDIDKNEVKDKWMPANLAKMGELQEKLFAQNQYSFLIVFQAMDAAGKEILHPVAVVIFGGLVSSTLMDSLLTPLLFWLFGRAPLQRLLEQQSENAF